MIGSTLSSAGDVNNDGFFEFLIGAKYATANGLSQAGMVYVIFGRTGAGV